MQLLGVTAQAQNSIYRRILLKFANKTDRTGLFFKSQAKFKKKKKRKIMSQSHETDKHSKQSELFISVSMNTSLVWTKSQKWFLFSTEFPPLSSYTAFYLSHCLIYIWLCVSSIYSAFMSLSSLNHFSPPHSLSAEQTVSDIIMNKIIVKYLTYLFFFFTYKFPVFSLRFKILDIIQFLVGKFSSDFSSVLFKKHLSIFLPVLICYLKPFVLSSLAERRLIDI